MTIIDHLLIIFIWRIQREKRVIKMKKYKIVSLLVLLVWFALLLSCQTIPLSTKSSEDPLISGFSKLASSSVSDAIDKVTGKRGFMSHEIKPVFPTKLCGYAVTVFAKPSEKSEPPKMALELIDTESPGKVLVIVMDGPDGADTAAFGGIMCTGAKTRGFAGAVLDGGCRDAREITAMKFPVYSRGIVPSNSLGRYVNIEKNKPVKCGGIEVTPGDILVGDADGIAVVPYAQAEKVLKMAEELERKEALTMKDVIKLKSIQKASEKNKRI